jgi:hypothetical protein
METPLECAWRQWDAFTLAFAQKTQEAAASGLEPVPPESTSLRGALAALSPQELSALLDDPRWRALPEGREPGRVLQLMLLCSLLPPTAENARVLAERFDDPLGAKSGLPPLPGMGLFVTLRWRLFLERWWARKAAVFELQALRHPIQGFVGGQHPLTVSDSPALIRELAQAERERQRQRRPRP